MTYGHEEPYLVSGEAGLSLRKPANDGAWRVLDAERRLAMIEQVLGHRRAAA